MSKLIMPGDPEAPLGLTTVQGIANFKELEKRIRASAINHMPAHGRMISEDYTYESNHVSTVFLNNCFNVATNPTLTAHKFIYGSSTYGGVGEACGPEAIDFMDSIPIATSGKKNFPTFFILEIEIGTAPSGTWSAIEDSVARQQVLAVDGTVRTNGSPGQLLTCGMKIKKVSGDVGMRVNQKPAASDLGLYVDGVRVLNDGAADLYHSLDDTDWHTCSSLQTPPYPYVYNPVIYGTPGSVFRIAWPFQTAGHVVYEDMACYLASAR